MDELLEQFVANLHGGLLTVLIVASLGVLAKAADWLVDEAVVLSSNWSLYFLGYPILISVIVNIGFNIAGGLGAGRSGEYMLFFTAAVALSATLAWFDSSDRRDIAAALRGAIKGSFA
jgi:hypothetical protein